jgi:DNA-binding PadR family transcriptional regulator
MEMKTEIQSFLPLTEATFFILLSLSPGPKHGYAIMKAVNQMSNGRISFSTGTLYGAIKRLLDQGWIVRNDEAEEGSDETTRSRKDYALTSLGRKVYNAEVARMKELVQLAVTDQPREA